VYVVAEHFMAQKDIEYHAKALHQIANSLGWKKDSKGRLNALIDSAANQKTLAGLKSVKELFNDYNILVNTNVNKDMFTGIQRVKEYLRIKNGKPKIYIFKNCVNLIRELKSYWWGNNDAPKKIDDHCLDELRYYLMSKPQIKEPTLTKSIIEKDKEKLYKKIKNERRR
jgi:G3E family GTPase